MQRNATRMGFKVTGNVLNIVFFSGMIVILAYKSTTDFCFTSWILSVMNKSIED